MTSFGDGRCPVCGAALWATHSGAVGSKTCPRCTAELWVLGESLFFVRQPAQTRKQFFAELAGELYGTSALEMARVLADADSLDLVEFVMEIEDAIRPRRRS